MNAAAIESHLRMGGKVTLAWRFRKTPHGKEARCVIAGLPTEKPIMGPWAKDPGMARWAVVWGLATAIAKGWFPNEAFVRFSVGSSAYLQARDELQRMIMDACEQGEAPSPDR